MLRLTFFVIILFLFSCKSNTEIGGEKNSAFVDNYQESKNDTLAMQEVAYGFLSWYKYHYQEANSFGLTYQDKQGNFHVSMVNCEAYLGYLKSSGFISEKYINTWLQYFNERATYFEQNLQNEGPPEGFELDYVLTTQEPELVFDALTNLQFEVFKIDETKATLLVAAHWGYELQLSKTDGKWLIDNIVPLNYEVEEDDL